MSGYGELVERCLSLAVYADRRKHIGSILAEVLRTLEVVTPEMRTAAAGEDNQLGDESGLHLEATGMACYLSVLHASPLTPPL